MLAELVYELYKQRNLAGMVDSFSIISSLTKNGDRLHPADICMRAFTWLSVRLATVDYME